MGGDLFAFHFFPFSHIGLCWLYTTPANVQKTTAHFLRKWVGEWMWGGLFSTSRSEISEAQHLPAAERLCVSVCVTETEN